ncbi:hypothetical protein N9D55_05270 [Flavobacteriaceae bacterium]|nr:hypothetical protein [Flavobacteriaceae bacterium]
MSSLKTLLLTFHASIADREKGVAYIKKNPTSFDELFDLACAAEKHREHIVAAWVFEHYILQHIESLTPLLDQFLRGAIAQTHESKRRPMAKVLYHYCAHEVRRSVLSNKQINTIVSICFAYMIDAKKIAAIAFAMKTLHFFRKHENWIEEELYAYIEQKRPNSSAGFKSLVNQLT